MICPRILIAAAAYLLAAMLLTSCAAMHQSADFERHRFSQIEVPRDRNDVFYFDVTLTALYPDEDPVAEQTRMEWLDAWMKQRRLCTAGYEIAERRPFGTFENNPARHDLRYEVVCTPPR